MSLAELVTHLRKSVGLTQEELAERALLNVSTIGDIERGETLAPRRHTLETLARVLELSEEQSAQLFRAAGRARVQQRSASSSRADRGEPDELARSHTGQHDPPATVVGLVKRIELSNQDVGEGVAGDANAGQDSKKSGEQGEHALGFASVEDLRAACERSVWQAIDSITKYDAGLFVARAGIDEEFDHFRAAKDHWFLLQGEAGIGKTNQVCHLAWETVAQRKVPALLFQGATHIQGRFGLWSLVAEELKAIGGRRLDPGDVVGELDTFLRAESSALIIFLDAINENTHVEDLKESLRYAASDVEGTSIKVCVSCRDVDWHLFESVSALTRRLYQPELTGGRAGRGLFLEHFTGDELARAWQLYAAHYRLRDVGDIPVGLADICRHPIMLQFLCEAFEGKRVPHGIHRKEIFDRYWREKLVARHGVETEAALDKLARAMFEIRTTQMTELEVVELIGGRHYTDLRSERVILYSALDPIVQQHQVGFTYDAFQEYATARHLWRRWRWASGAADIAGDLQGLLPIAEDYRATQGILLYLLLFLEDVPKSRDHARDVVRQLAGAEDRWKIFACDFLTKLNGQQIVEESVPLLVSLTRDPHFTVRWAAASALGILAQSGSAAALDELKAMVERTDWMAREAAAIAASHLHRDFAVAASMLERLADDISWRVRRAVGSSLDNLCRTARADALDLMQCWVAERDRWRLRRAVAQAKYGMQLVPQRAVDMLAHLAADDTPDIRWRAVSDLVAMLRHVEVKSRAFELLQLLATDKDLFVRRHIAFWLRDIFKATGEECASLLRTLANDRTDAESYKVRGEAARTLGTMPDHPLVREYIILLSDDDHTEVAFAAQYSGAALGLPGTTLAELRDATDEHTRLLALREELARSSREMKKPDGAPDIYSTWKHDRYEFIREVLTNGLGELDTPERFEAFFELLRQDEDEGIRWAVSSLLPDARLLDAAAKVHFLLALSSDPHYWTRRESMSSLAKLVRAGAVTQTDEIRAAAERAAYDDEEDPEVCYATLECMEAMRAAGMEAPAHAISALCKHGDRQVAEYAQRLSTARVPSS